MDPAQAALACKLLKCPKVIPMHFGTFPPLTGTPDALVKRVGDLNTEVWALEPGKPVQW
jgi:L-ascorbate metabolism protein UlaG (beta-lactamase superfamily)